MPKVWEPLSLSMCHMFCFFWGGGANKGVFKKWVACRKVNVCLRGLRDGHKFIPYIQVEDRRRAYCWRERKKEGGKEDRVTLRKDYCRNGSGEGTGRWFGGRLRRRDGTFFLEHYHNEEAWTAVINNLVRTNMTTKETKSSSSAWEHTTSCVWITSHRNVFLHTNKFMQTGLRILLWGPARSWKWFCYPN